MTRAVTSGTMHTTEQRGKTMVVEAVRGRLAKLVEAADALLLVLRFADPDLLLVLDDVGQHSAAQKHHVLAPRRVLDADLEL